MNVKRLMWVFVLFLLMGILAIVIAIRTAPKTDGGALCTTKTTILGQAAVCFNLQTNKTYVSWNDNDSPTVELNGIPGANVSMRGEYVFIIFHACSPVVTVGRGGEVVRHCRACGVVDMDYSAKC